MEKQKCTILSHIKPEYTVLAILSILILIAIGSSITNITDRLTQLENITIHQNKMNGYLDERLSSQFDLLLFLKRTKKDK